MALFVHLDSRFFTDSVDTSLKSGSKRIPIENGIGVHETWDGVNPVDDQYRIDYMQEHINAMLDAIHLDGAPVLGYLGWGLIDLLSSKGDMRKRYRLVYVNRENLDIKDMKSSPKRSYYWFKDLIEKLGYEVK